MLPLIYISPLSHLLPILIFLLFFRGKKELSVWVIFFYCIYSFSNDLIILYRSDHKLEYLIFLYTFTIIEYLFFSILLYSLIQSKVLRKGIIVISLLFIGFCLYNIINTPIKKFDSVQASIESILVIAYCIIYFYQQLNQPQVTFIYASYTFWIVIGILIYLSGTFFLYAFASDLPPQVREHSWIINLICTILKNLLFTAAIFIHGRKPKSPQAPTPVDPGFQPFLN